MLAARLHGRTAAQRCLAQAQVLQAQAIHTGNLRQISCVRGESP
jgi:hypothetical protein